MDTVKLNQPMPEGNRCPQCGTPLPANAPAGLCPACLLKQGTVADTVTDAKQPSFNPPTSAELAAKFPQLEILELIGKGGMGAVYRARQKELDRIVALKILPPGIGGDSGFAERFAREAKALAKLNHPGIVTLYEFGRADLPVSPDIEAEPPHRPTGQLYYFLMEFVDGVNLRQLLHAGRVSPREALAIVPQICDALQYAHDQGIVHRDIKPENILLDRRGRVKVADFGLVKIVAQASSPAGSGGVPAASSGTTEPGGSVNPQAGKPALQDLTEAGKVMGTPQYMAPEQKEHPTEVDHRADIYALGVVFYQMLTGELPGKKIEPPSKKVSIDVHLDEVVLRALEKKPELRYQQASVLKTQVETIASTLGSSRREQVTESQSTHANPKSASLSVDKAVYEIGGFFKRIILGVGIGAGVILLALLVYAIVSGKQRASVSVTPTRTVLTFGPTIERVFQVEPPPHWTNLFLRIHTGEFLRPPQTKLDRAFFSWWTNNVNLSAEPLRGQYRGLWSFAVFNMRLSDFPSDNWDTATPSQVDDALLKPTTLPHPRHYELSQHTYVLPAARNLPWNLAFSTTDGDRGLLQIVSFTSNPPSLKIRYKLVRASETTASPTGTATSRPDYGQAVIALGAMSGLGDTLEDALNKGDQVTAQKAIGPFLTQLHLLNSALQGSKIELPTNVVSLYLQAGQAIQAGDMALGKSLYAAASDAGDAWETTVPGGSYGDQLLALYRQHSNAPQNGPQVTAMSSGQTTTNFFIGQSYFPRGDSIEISSVERTPERIVVKGHYDLVSRGDAQLTLNIASTNQSHFPQGARQSMRITKGHGDFELIYKHLISGTPHVSMYANGHPFAGIYFGTKEEAANSYQMDLNDYLTKTSPTTETQTFGPVIERVVTRDEAGPSGVVFLDLARGDVWPAPFKLEMEKSGTPDGHLFKRTPRIENWIASSGVDLALQLNKNNWALQPLGTRLVFQRNGRKLSLESLEHITPGRLSRIVSETKSLPDYIVSRGAETSAYPVTSTDFFMTRHGRMGVIQLTGFTNDSSGVKIRYRLVESVNSVIERVSGKRTVQTPAVPPHLSFGPVVERTLVDSKMPFKSDAERTNALMMIDFDSGSLFSAPQAIWQADTNAQRRWMQNKRIDALCVIPEVNGLVGLDMKSARVLPSMWRNVTAVAVTDILKESSRQDTTLFHTDGLLPSTWVFQTREDSMGILQIIGFTKNPRGVKIRYKLVQKPETSQTENHTIRGRVVDQTGKPLGDIRWRTSAVEKWRDDQWELVHDLGLGRWNFTSANGRFDLTFHGKQRFDLQFDGREFAPAFVYEVSQESRNLKVVMKPGIPVHGTVVAPNSDRIPGNVRVELQLPCRGVWYQRKTATDADGHFTFYVCPPPTEPNKAFPSKWQVSCAGTVVPFDATGKSISMRLSVNARAEVIVNTNEPIGR